MGPILFAHGESAIGQGLLLLFFVLALVLVEAFVLAAAFMGKKNWMMVVVAVVATAVGGIGLSRLVTEPPRDFEDFRDTFFSYALCAWLAACGVVSLLRIYANFKRDFQK